MRTQILRPIVIGILLGAAIFIMPFFLLRAVIIILIIGALLRLFFKGRHYRRGFGSYPVFTDKIRNMTDEEYNAFKQKYQGCGGYNRNRETTAKENK